MPIDIDDRNINGDNTTTIDRRPLIYPEEIRFLQNLFMNSDKYVFFDPATRSTYKDESLSEPETLRIGAITYKMPNPRRYAETAPVQDRPKFGEGNYSYVRFAEDNETLSSQRVLDSLKECLANIHTPQRPLHFLLLNELAISYRNSKDLLRKMNGVLDSVDKAKLIGILGSYHCNDSYFNISPIVSPFTDEKNSYSVAGEVAKQTSATKQGENIRTSDKTSFVRYKTPYGIIMVWICLDMYDPNLVLKLIRTNNRLSLARGAEPAANEVVDVLFIPSYNADLEQNVRNMARLISRFARTAVIVGNDNVHYGRNRKRQARNWNNSFCYYFGEEIEPSSGDEKDHYTVQAFEIPAWGSRKELRSSPSEADFSPLFCQIFGMQAASFVPVS